MLLSSCAGQGAGARSAVRPAVSGTTASGSRSNADVPRRTNPPRPVPRRLRAPTPPADAALPQTTAFPVASGVGFAAEMRALWQAIVTDQPPVGLPAFFPLAAYLQVKTLADPAADWRYRLVGDFALDVGAAHAVVRAVPQPSLVGVDVPAAQASWVRPGTCANRVGYWHVADARMVYSTGAGLRSFGIASLISWRGIWYVVHLGAVVRHAAARLGRARSPAAHNGLMADAVLAIDIGGTKMAAALVAPDGRLLVERRTPTPSGTAGAEDLFGALVSVCDDVTGDASLIGVGVGCGGPMEWPAGRVSPLNIPCWRGFPLRERLAERFAGLPVRLHNDAVCVAAGEHWQGAGRGTSNMLGMVISTGVGGGLVLDDRLIDGGSGNAGHIGHVVVDPEGPDCVCGGRGCLEAIARGPAVVRWAREHGWSALEPASGPELVAAATAGDPVAAAALQRAGRAAGIAIASAASLCDLEVVSVGGGLSAAGDLLMAPLQDAVRRYARLSFSSRVTVTRAHLGSAAGLVGAAALVLVEDRYWSAG